MLAVRDAIPKVHNLAEAEFATLRLRLLKIAARVVKTASRVRLAFAAACQSVTQVPTDLNGARRRMHPAAQRKPFSGAPSPARSTLPRTKNPEPSRSTMGAFGR